MASSLNYLGMRAVSLVAGFLRHWYADGFIYVAHKGLSVLEELDQTFALKVTLRHMFEPLYQDYSPVGRILGFMFRAFRLAVGGVVYLFVSTVTIACYVIWAIIPLYLTLKMFI